MAENEQEELYATYKVVRTTEDPHKVVGDRGLGLSRPFLITPEPDIDENLFSFIAAKHAVVLRKINKWPGMSMLCEASVNGRSVDALARLEWAIDEVGFLLNAAHDYRYTHVLYPPTANP